MSPGVGMSCVPVLDDNRGAVVLAKKSITNSKSKHINVRYFEVLFIRELVGWTNNRIST